MAVDEETGNYAMGQGCPSHGDDHMRECSMCGAEFCRVCHPKTAVCPDCAESSDDDEDEEDDFEEAGDAADDDEEEDEKGDKEEKEDLPRGGVLDDGDDRRY